MVHLVFSARSWIGSIILSLLDLNTLYSSCLYHSQCTNIREVNQAKESESESEKRKKEREREHERESKTKYIMLHFLLHYPRIILLFHSVLSSFLLSFTLNLCCLVVHLILLFLLKTKQKCFMVPITWIIPRWRKPLFVAMFSHFALRQVIIKWMLTIFIMFERHMIYRMCVTHTQISIVNTL